MEDNHRRIFKSLGTNTRRFPELLPEQLGGIKLLEHRKGVVGFHVASGCLCERSDISLGVKAQSASSSMSASLLAGLRLEYWSSLV